MRALLFKVVTQVSAGMIWVINSISHILLKVVGTVGYWLMNLIDSKKVSVYEQMLEGAEEEVTELQAQTMELKLLNGALQVRDHAEENDWTEQHTEAMNAIGDALIVEHGWEEESVHQYLKSLVESIDGLEYGGE